MAINHDFKVKNGLDVGENIKIDGTVVVDTGGEIITAQLKDSGVTAGTYGDSSNIPQITVDGKGRVTEVTDVSVTIANDFLTGLSFADGTLTASVSNQSDVTVSLDGRYQPAGTYDNYGSWLVSDGNSTVGVFSGNQVNFEGDGATDVTFDSNTNTFTISSTDTNDNYFVTGGTFTEGTGILNLNRTSPYPTIQIDMDGRYELLGTNDNYGSWTASDGTTTAAITSGETVTFSGSGATSVTFNDSTQTYTISSTDNNDNDDTTYSVALSDGAAGEVDIDLTAGGSGSGTDSVTLKQGSNVSLSRSGDVVTISSTDTNTDTTYTAGTGLSLSGTQFNANVNAAVQTTAASAVTTNGARTYAVQVDGSDNLVVNVPWSDTNTETTTSLSLSGDTLTYTDETGTANDISLSKYIDDTNLARLTSGTLNNTTGIATFTRDDASTFTVDFSEFLASGSSFDGTFDGTINATRLRLTASDDASLSSTLHALQIGSDAGQNLILDNNEIHSRTNGAISTLFLNGDGGEVKINGNLATNTSFLNGQIISTSNNTGSEPYVQLKVINTGTSAGIKLHSQTTSGKNYEIQSDISGDLIVYDRDAQQYRLRLNANGVDAVTGGLRVGGTTVIDSDHNATLDKATIAGKIQLEPDDSYSGYYTVGFQGVGTGNGVNKIFAHGTGGDGLYICSASSRNINFRTNGGTANTFIMTASGDFRVGETTVIDSGRNGTFAALSSNGTTSFQVDGITDLNAVPGGDVLSFTPFVSEFQAANRSGSNYNGGFQVGSRVTGYLSQFVVEAQGVNSPPKFRNQAGGTWGDWQTFITNRNPVRVITDSEHQFYKLTNGGGVSLRFSDVVSTQSQSGYFKYFHQDDSSHGSGNAFTFTSTEPTLSFAVDGKIISDDGFYIGFNAANHGTQVIDSSRNGYFNNGFFNELTATGYTEIGDGVGSVSNDGSWNARLNVAGSQHAKIDVKSVSDGIITSVYSHTGQAQGRIGTTSNHNLALLANGSVKAVVTTTGRVGVNIESPTKTLDVRGNAFFGSGGSTVSRSTNGVGISYTSNTAFVGNSDLGDGERYLSITNDSTSANACSAISLRTNPNATNVMNSMVDIKLVSATATHGFLTFTTRSSSGVSKDALSISDDGNIGIHNTIPQHTLDLATPNSGSSKSIRLDTANGNTSGTSDTVGSYITFAPHYTNYSKRSAGIAQIAEGNYFRSGLAFYTNNITDATSDWAERLRISMDGNVGIGEANPTDIFVIRKDSTASQIVTYRNNSGGFNQRIYADYNNDGTTTELQTRVGVDGNYSSIGNFSNHGLQLRTNNVNRLDITPDGTVGIKQATTLSSTAGSVYTAMKIEQSNGNIASLNAYHVRTSTGSDWTTAAYRFQQKIDSTYMGYIQFNGTSRLGEVTIGAGTTTSGATGIGEKLRILSSGSVIATNFQVSPENTTGTYMKGISSIAFTDSTSAWDTAYNHGIRSTSNTGTFGDDISINSYHDVTVRLDSNSNNSGSYFRVQNDTSGAHNGDNNLPFWTGHDGTGARSRMWGRVGINAEPSASDYALNMGGHVNLNNKEINYVNQLHFNDNVRLIDNGNDTDLILKAGDSGSVYLKLNRNGTNTGGLYADTSAVGILDKDNQWAIRHQFDSHTEFRDNNEVTFSVGQGGISGDFGTVQTNDTGKNGYAGYSIGGRVVFMHDIDTNSWGIYNDANNEWMIYGDLNGKVDLRYNSTVKLQTTSTGVEVVGLLTATQKSFTIDHPTKEGKKLRYGSLEGPENGVYVRGRLKGDNVIELPECWTGLVHEDSITVDLTPIGRAHVWVEDLDGYTVTVGSDAEEVNCFYVVYGERKDVDKLEVEFDA